MLDSADHTSQQPATSAGAFFGWVLLALGTLVWLLIVPVSALSAAFSVASPTKMESGFAATGVTIFGILGGTGLSCLSYSFGNEHAATRTALWLYYPLLTFGIVTAVILQLIT